MNGEVAGDSEGQGLLSQNWDGLVGIGLSGGIRGVVDEFYMYNHALAASDIADVSQLCNLGAGKCIVVLNDINPIPGLRRYGRGGGGLGKMVSP